MEEEWVVGRTELRHLLEKHPEWSRPRMAEELGYSLSWVKKWVRRFQAADPDDEEVVFGLSRARKHPPPKVAELVVEKVLAIRDQPPENLRRTPGPKAILYYLHQDEELQKSGHPIPCGTRVIWEILDRHQRIRRRSPPEHEPLEPAVPWEQWGIDFKDVSSVPAEPEGKQQHVVEILNVVDHGTSAVVDSDPQADFTAETSLRAGAGVLQKHGRPQVISLDRDPRWVGSWTGKDFPSALLRFLHCLGIETQVCPPQRPDRNPFVERYHRSLKHECLLLENPADLSATRAANAQYVQHYNFERPHQAPTCRNQPPRLAHPDPPKLPQLPKIINPDAWLDKLHDKRFKRRIDASGRVQIGKHKYYIRQKLRGRYVTLKVDAPNQQFIVELNRQPSKQVPIKGLFGHLMTYDDFLHAMCQDAFSDWSRVKRSTPRYV